MRANEAEDLWQHVDFDCTQAKTGNVEGMCFIWTGAKDRDGYGFFKLRGKQWRVARLVLELCGVEIPPGWNASPICLNHSCVRPSHLMPLPTSEIAKHRHDYTGEFAGKRKKK